MLDLDKASRWEEQTLEESIICSESYSAERKHVDCILLRIKFIKFSAYINVESSY